MKLSFRQLNNSDRKSVQDFADFLSLCYRHRYRKGETFLPDHQDEETTRRRIADAEVWVAEQDGRIIASFSIVFPEKAVGSWWYRLPGVSEVNQIAIHPDHQGWGGYFRILMEAAEKRALELGVCELAGKIPSQQQRLLQVYMRRGYRIVDCRWPTGRGYGSVIFSKTIQGNPLMCSPLRRFRRKFKYFRRYVKYGVLKG